MKKLVCEKDIQKLVNEGKKVCYVTEDTLVTPSAKTLQEQLALRFLMVRNRRPVAARLRPLRPHRSPLLQLPLRRLPRLPLPMRLPRSAAI